MCMVAECPFYFFQIGAATGENNTSEQLVCKLIGHLEPYIFNDFFQSSFHYLYEFTAFYAAILVDRQLQCIVYIVIIGVCAAIIEFHLFSILLVYLQCGDVFGDIVSAQWDNGKVTTIGGNEGGVINIQQSDLSRDGPIRGFGLLE